VIRDIWNSDVNRWHANDDWRLRESGETISQHQFECEALGRYLFPGAPETLFAAIRNHDEPEKLLGDMPFTAKRDFPELAEAYARAELIVIERLNIPQPANDWEAGCVKLVDRLQTYLHVKRRARDLLAAQDWRNAWADILTRADALGVRGAVFDLIGECGG
jgi:5'-deoxynucleotidase YfbR-like HD superfamily hydrolase